MNVVPSDFNTISENKYIRHWLTTGPFPNEKWFKPIDAIDGDW